MGPQPQKADRGGWVRASRSGLADPAELLETGRDAVEIVPGPADAGVEVLDEFDAPGEPGGEAVDVDLAPVELGQDGVEFGHCLLVGQIRRRTGLIHRGHSPRGWAGGRGARVARRPEPGR